jgi:hypothetical protein
MQPPRSDGIFPRMRRMRMILLCVVALPTIFLAAGCTGSGGDSQVKKEHHAHDESHGESHSANLAMSPEGGTGVKGTAAFEDASGDVTVELKLRNLPKPDTLYLAHIHPGTCAQEEKEGEMEEEHHEHAKEIEYPLSEVKSDSQGHGSSTTTVHKTFVKKLFSGGAKHVNVHEAGAGNPPVLSCADLRQTG